MVVKPSDTIRSCMSKLSTTGARLLLVTDQDNVLQGVVSDGDIRRSIESGSSLEMTVEMIMSTTPYFAFENWTSEQCMQVLKKYDVPVIPVLDDQRRVIGINSIFDAIEPVESPNVVVIMAGGFGTRLRPLTETCPKPMLRICGVPMLEIIMRTFIAHGFNDFIISTHYLADVIKNYFGDGAMMGVSIEYVHEHTPLGTAGVISLLPKGRIEKPFVLTNGDIISDLDITAMLNQHINNKKSPIATVAIREHSYQIPYGEVSLDKGLIHSFTEKPTKSVKVNAGIYVLEPRIMKKLSLHREVDMPTLLQEQISHGEIVSSYMINGYWRDIGRPNDLDLVQEEISQNFNVLL